MIALVLIPEAGFCYNTRVIAGSRGDQRLHGRALIVHNTWQVVQESLQVHTLLQTSPAYYIRISHFICQYKYI